MIRIAELPREAFQALNYIIPTDVKVKYLNALLRVGFDTVEVTSIVSPKVLPQMGDAMEVLEKLDLSGSRSKLMVLLVNKKGAELAAAIPFVHYLAYPFSISPRFLELNLHSTTEKSLEVIDYIQDVCTRTGKEFVCYFSMAFGNPYNDPWNIELLLRWIGIMQKKGIRIIPLSNVALPVMEEKTGYVFSTITRDFPGIETGLHLHTRQKGWESILEAAYRNGCRRFDSVIGGLGGCPMTGKELLANLDTRNLLYFLNKKDVDTGLDTEALQEVLSLVPETFGFVHPFK